MNIIYPAPPLPQVDDESFILPEEQYVPEIVTKTGIVLHHTESGPSVKGVYDWWLERGQEKKVRVGTAYIIGLNGVIYRLFPDNNWAWHLGKGNSNTHEKRTIGIELISAGPLTKVDEEHYRTIIGARPHDKNKVTDLGKSWRGFKYFDKYTREQIDSVVRLVYYLCNKYDIPKQVLGDLWTYSESNKIFKGIYSHAQVRPDKKDIHPKFPIKYLAKWAQLQIK